MKTRISVPASFQLVVVHALSFQLNVLNLNPKASFISTPQRAGLQILNAILSDFGNPKEQK